MSCKRPITPAVLRRVKGLWEHEGIKVDHIMLWAAMLLCFFGFLRSGEITVPLAQEFDPSYHVTPKRRFSGLAAKALPTDGEPQRFKDRPLPPRGLSDGRPY